MDIMIQLNVNINNNFNQGSSQANGESAHSKEEPLDDDCVDLHKILSDSMKKIADNKQLQEHLLREIQKMQKVSKEIKCWLEI